MMLRNLGLLFTAVLTVAAAPPAKRHVKSAVPTTAKVTTGWAFKTETDAMSDKTTITASLRSGETGLLDVWCQVGDKESLRVLVSSTKVSPRAIRRMDSLTYRYDDLAPVSSDWLYIGSSAALTTTGQAAPFLTPANTAKTLLIRLFGPDDVPADEKFDLAGTPAAMSKLLKSCNFIT